ncbi:uncharacterized protein LOC121143589 isoform X2 [Mesocricetus auratus]|uniref:Uncharacterized protein LOC121143589 isoform X2 n=1 Tax=Mesocricetus auratus TaxID=10036 RepID=A0ABM2YA46_MESAU|nr:uncharacterized protein LOC121143589 isoform X2 [Mesocricetus auratus]
MAAAVIAQLIPKLHSLASSESGYYIGRHLWFGLVVLYGMVVYVAHISWAHIKEDFICSENITLPCLITCFGKRFPIPIMGTWYFFYFIFIALFCLIEVFMALLREEQVKVMKSMVSMMSLAKDLEGGLMVPNKELSISWKKSILNLHREKSLLLLYLLYTLLQGPTGGHQTLEAYEHTLKLTARFLLCISPFPLCSHIQGGFITFLRPSKTDDVGSQQCSILPASHRGLRVDALYAPSHNLV